MYEQDVIQLVRDNPAFLGTVDENRPRVRPMKPYIDEKGQIWLVTAAHSKKIAEITANPRAELCTLGQNEFVQIYGELRQDHSVTPAFIGRIFDAIPEMKEYFTGTSDPEIAVYSLAIHQISYARGRKVYTTGFDIKTEVDVEALLCAGGFCLVD
ncbi:MAG: pyridoxamine 5'-phosphate oxidase family protein [Negativicutes bacterium]|nr:pyridoxamine 5'-phosphate oxidase family protein [Negativicutes bacterium]